MIDFLFKSETRKQGKFNLTYNIWDEMYKDENVLFIDLLKADRFFNYEMDIDGILYFIDKAVKRNKYTKLLLVDTWEVITSNFMIELIVKVIDNNYFTPKQIIVKPVLYPRENLVQQFKDLGVELWHANYFFPREYFLNKDINNTVSSNRKLICLNNQDTVARRYMISQLFEHNVKDNISWGGANDIRFGEGKFYRWNLQRSAKDMAECCTIDDMNLLNKYRDWFNESHTIAGDIYLPKVADLTISSPIWSAPINMVVETRTQPHFPIKLKGREVRDVYSNDYLFVTEKTVKALMSGQIFCLFSSRGILKYLHDFGFKTFGDYIDESYDTETNWTVRAEKIAANIKHLIEMPEDQWQKLWSDIQPIVQYNRTHIEEFVLSGKYMFKMY